VVVEVPNDDGALLPGLFARARWTLPRQDPLLLVPKECVFERYGKRALYVVEDGADGERRAQVRFIGVRSLADEPGSWLVSEGVEDGEFVVVSPIEELSPGSQVELEGGV
jgi:multidrug efflux pump subunit AcrA (membrane-fusion protein)